MRQEGASQALQFARLKRHREPHSPLQVRRRREQAQAGAVVAMSVTTDDATPGPFDYSKEVICLMGVRARWV